MQPIILVHGGAGTINDPEKIRVRLIGIKAAALAGYRALQSSGSVLDGVEAAVNNMEDNEHFNAGLGSILALDGSVEMDASIMRGADLAAGAVTVIRDVKNPVTIARMVMEKTEHILLAGSGAQNFAVSQGVSLLPPDALVTPFQRATLANYQRTVAAGKQVDPLQYGTVGAVGMDGEGRLAAATSTGGREGKMVGRCSDTCMIGSGTYADDVTGVAVSTTGHGESIAKVCLAHSIVSDISSSSSTAQTASHNQVHKMTDRLGQTAGVITLSRQIPDNANANASSEDNKGCGHVGIAFSSRCMSWAYVREGYVHYGIHKGQHEMEKVDL